MAVRRPPAYQQSTFRRLYDNLAELLDHRIGWHRLPVPLGLAVLGGLCDVLRRHNLCDTSALPAVNLPTAAPATPQVRTTRTMDGTYADLNEPRGGMAGSRLGRNGPIDRTYQDPPSEFMQPSKREVSRALLTRDQFIPATSANALLAVWLQFMIKGWFGRGTGPKDRPWKIPLTEDDLARADISDPAILTGATRAELAALFRAGTAKTIPNGRGRGTVLLGTGGLLARLAALVAYALLWRGKVVNAQKGRLKNLISAFSVEAIAAEVYKQDSWYDEKPCIVLDYSKTSLVARMIRDEIREIAPGIYLGLVFWGKRHLLDFALDFTGPVGAAEGLL